MDRVSWGLRKLAGLGPESSPPDAQLLALYLLGDPDALMLILERHGAGIWRVCRARLSEADADDAFQATVVSFIRGAKSIRSPELLGAWLVRVAALTSRKALSRRRGEVLSDEPSANQRGPAEAVEQREAVAKVVAEVERLPAKSRAVVTLCVLEGHTTKEAARVLGVPLGTADTRLAAAKALLRKRLTRLGLAPSLLGLLADPLGGASAAAHARRLAELAPTFATQASPAILALTVTGGMTMTAKLLTAVALVGVGVGAAGLGVWRAGAGDAPQAKPAEVAKPAGEGKKPAEKPAAEVKESESPQVMSQQKQIELPYRLTTTQAAARIRNILDTPSGIQNLSNLTLENLFHQLQEQHNLFIRFDFAAFQRYQGLQMYEQMNSPDRKIYETRVVGSNLNAGLPLRDLLTDVLARSIPEVQLSLVVQGNQILISPAYFELGVPGVTAVPGQAQPIERRIFGEMRNGPPVSVEFNNETLASAVAILRAKTGANIVVKAPRSAVEGRPPETFDAAFSDVRLATVLEILADIARLQLVVIGNVFYLTDEVSANRMQEKVNREVLGTPPAK